MSAASRLRDAQLADHEARIKDLELDAAVGRINQTDLDQRLADLEEIVPQLIPLLSFLPAAGLDVTAPIIVGVQAISITTTSFVASWITNEASDSLVNYGTTGSYGSSTTLNKTLQTTHLELVSGLSAATLYHYRVRSIDSSGNEVIGSDQTVTTLTSGTDTTAPVISNVTANVLSSTNATISWDLDEPATGQIEYGTTTAYGSFSEPELSFVYSNHVQTLAGLTPGTTYHYRVLSADASGNAAVGDDGTFSTQSGPPPPGEAGYPPDRPNLTFVTRPSIPSVPALGISIVDPTWQTQIVRISDTDGRRHAYSKIAAWSYDSTKILLPFGSPWQMLDGTTYASIRTSSTLLGNAVWSMTDNNKIYGTYNADANLYTQNMTTDAQTSIHNFTATPFTEVDLGSSEGAISDGDAYCALKTDNSGTHGLLVYDIQGDSVIATLSWGASEPDNVQISRGGQYVLVQWGSDGTGSTQGWWRYTRNLASAIQLSSIGRHFDTGYDINGNEIAVTCSPDVVSYNLASGAGTQLLPSNNAYEYGHVSMRAHERNGWVYLSTYSYTDTTSRIGQDQLIACKTDGSGIVEVFGFVNHLGDGSEYDAQPQASVSPDGARMIYASDWGTTTGPVYCYVAGLTV